jgi:sporulation protein YlmC with PRC-barrel domain
MKQHKTVVASAFAAILGLGVGSQSLAVTEADPAPEPAAATTPNSDAMPMSADDLLDQDVVTVEGEEVGEIESVIISNDGRVNALVVGVGGFLGLGEREVALDWNQVNVNNEGEIALNLSKEELEALPEYEYPDGSQKGMSFYDSAYDTQSPITPSEVADNKPTAVPSPVAAGATGAVEAPERTDLAAMETEKSGWSEALGPQGEIRASKFVGSEIMNADDESIGEVEEVLIENDNQVQAVVSVGGFLGVGERHALIAWDQLNIERQGNEVRIGTNMSKDELAQLPEYQVD